MIGVEGTYLISFSVGKLKDFIRSEDLTEFQIVEECGNLLPMWKLSFMSYNTEVSNYWNEGNTISMSFGPNRDGLKDVSLVITEKSILPSGNKTIYTAVGLLDKLAFVNVPHTRTIGPHPGGIVLGALAMINKFTLDENNPKEDTFEDSDTWHQNNITDKKFMDYIAARCYKKDSAYGIGISSDGRYILRDLRDWLAKPYKYKFTDKPSSKKDIQFVDKPILSSNSGFLNAWAGYGREKPMMNGITGNMLYHVPQLKPFLSLLGTVASKFVTKSSSPAVKLSQNIDPNTLIALSNNMTALTRLSSECCQLTYINRFDPIDLFDLCMVEISEPTKPRNSNSSASGLYTVGLISRKIEGTGVFRFSTTVKLFRESSNDTQVS